MVSLCPSEYVAKEPTSGGRKTMNGVANRNGENIRWNSLNQLKQIGFSLQFGTLNSSAPPFLSFTRHGVWAGQGDGRAVPLGCTGGPAWWRTCGWKTCPLSAEMTKETSTSTFLSGSPMEDPTLVTCGSPMGIPGRSVAAMFCSGPVRWISHR